MSVLSIVRAPGECRGLFVLLGLLWAALAGGAEVRLQWDANSETNLAGYRIYVGEQSAYYPINQAVLAPATQTTVSNLLAGHTYYFAATAYVDTGAESDFSEEISYTVPVAAPTGFKVTTTLQGAATPAGPWRNVEDLATAQVALVPGTNRFFRAILLVNASGYVTNASK